MSPPRVILIMLLLRCETYCKTIGLQQIIMERQLCSLPCIPNHLFYITMVAIEVCCDAECGGSVVQNLIKFFIEFSYTRQM